ncbi:MAG TPA: hypothetical protein VE961_07105, partial [Pyrinomonadaceae bacterium]|nr:hypothetical protein [Pyrinomonadaceae bacterium]
IQGPNQEAVFAGTKVGVIHGPLLSRPAPYFVSAFQHELIAQSLAGVKIKTKEIDLKIVLGVGQVAPQNLRVA